MNHRGTENTENTVNHQDTKEDLNLFGPRTCEFSRRITAKEAVVS